MGFRSVLSYCIGSLEECQLDRTSPANGGLSPAKQLFDIYPNPSSGAGFLHVDIADGAPGVMTVADSEGRVVLRTQLASGVNAVPVEDLTAGVYLLSFAGAQRTFVKL